MKIENKFHFPGKFMKNHVSLKKNATMVITIIIVLSAFLPAASSKVQDTSDCNNIVTIGTKNNLFPIFLEFLQKIIDYFQQKPIFHGIITILTRIKTMYTVPNASVNELDIKNPTQSSDSKIKEKSQFLLNGPRADWTVELGFTETDGSFDDAFFGEKTDASDGIDSYDVPKILSGIAPYIRGWFATPFANPYNSLWNEFKKHPDVSKVWNLTIQWIPSDYSSPTTMTIDWNTIEINASGYSSVILYDVANGVNVADMLIDNNYVFSCPAMILQTFEIRCAQNQNPTAFDDSAIVDEDSIDNPIDVLANDIDPDGDSLTITSVSLPNNGSVTSNGLYVFYTPNADFSGSDTCIYTISDGNGGTATATVNITINPLNDNPQASNDTATVSEDSNSTQIDVLTNDVDIDGDDLDITAVSTPSHGTATYTADYVYYSPDPDYSGADQFSYTISDGNGGSDSATVYVTVTGVNDPPVANDDVVTVVEDSADNQIDVLANDTDPDGDDLDIAGVTQPSHGLITYTADYVYYTPDGDYTGTDQFSYSITDNNGGSDIATVTITITTINDPPIANDDSAVVAEDTIDNQIDVLGNDIDPDGDILNIISITQPSNGAATYTIDHVNYTPNLNYNGLDSFSYVCIC